MRAAVAEKPAGGTPVPSGTEGRHLTIAQRALLAVVAIECLLVYGPTIVWLFDRWTMSVWHNAHGMLIPLAVAYFAHQELRALGPVESRANPWGFAFLLTALALHVLDTGMHTQILSAASIVIALPGLSLLFLGTAKTRAIAFPLAFMVFMLPIPLVLTERIHLVLREITTVATAAIVPWLGISLYSEGTTLHLREGVLAVSDACSGFSTLYASCAVAALVAYTCDRRVGKIAALAGAVPIAIASNIIRIVLLVLAVRLLGIQALDTWIHPASGMLTFAIALPVILWLGAPTPAPAREGAR
ncbi:MAG TPA: exosortase/archaeosortase family protein [Vicinamibacterales bacterium]